MFCHTLYNCYWWLVNNRKKLTPRYLKAKYTKDRITTEAKTIYNCIELIVSLAYVFLPGLTIYYLDELSIINSFWSIASVVFEFIMVILVLSGSKYIILISTVLNVISTYYAYTVLDLRRFIPYIIFWTASMIVGIQMLISDKEQ